MTPRQRLSAVAAPINVGFYQKAHFKFRYPELDVFDFFAVLRLFVDKRQSDRDQ